MPKTALEILEEARNLISHPGAWTQATEARDADRKPVAPSSADACSWCSIGVLERVADDPVGYGSGRRLASFRHALGILNARLGTRGEPPLTIFNDGKGRTQAEIVALFDAAIAAAQDRAFEKSLPAKVARVREELRIPGDVLEVEREALETELPIGEPSQSPTFETEDAKDALLASRIAEKLHALGSNQSLGAPGRELEERLRRGVRADVLKLEGEVKALRMRLETLERAFWGLLGVDPAEALEGAEEMIEKVRRNAEVDLLSPRPGEDR